MGLEPPRKGESRDRVLTDEELAGVWLSAPQSIYGDIIRLAILTGQRIGQINALRGEYVRDQTITWPASAMKANKRHMIPLIPTVAAIIEPYPRIGFLFATVGAGPLCIRMRHKRELDEASGVSNFIHHDIRRSVATKMAELGVAPHVVERILAHSSGTISGVAAIYNRATYLPEMRSALLSFEQRLQALASKLEDTNGRRNLLDIHAA